MVQIFSLKDLQKYDDMNCALLGHASRLRIVQRMLEISLGGLLDVKRLKSP